MNIGVYPPMAPWARRGPLERPRARKGSRMLFKKRIRNVAPQSKLFDYSRKSVSGKPLLIIASKEFDAEKANISERLKYYS